MNVTIERVYEDIGRCIVELEDGEPRIYGESRILYHIKKTLNAQGYDLIKKRMWKDGHLVDERQQYIRARKPTGDPMKDIAIWNPGWVVKDIAFNKDGRLVLEVIFNIWGRPKKGGAQ